MDRDLAKQKTVRKNPPLRREVAYQQAAPCQAVRMVDCLERNGTIVAWRAGSRDV